MWKGHGSREHDHVVLLVDSFTLTGAAQVIVGTDQTFVPIPHHCTFTPVTCHIGVHHVLGVLRSTMCAVFSLAFSPFFNVETENIVIDHFQAHAQFFIGGESNKISLFISVEHLEGASSQALEDFCHLVGEQLAAGGLAGILAQL